MRVLVAVLLFLTSNAFAQKLVIRDSLTEKTVKVKEGKVLGIITLKDTIDPYLYSDSTYEIGTASYRPDGIWILDKIDRESNTIQLKPKGKDLIKAYPINEIKYFQYRIEKDSRYRESLFWIGAVGCSITGIFTLFDSQASIAPKIGLLSVGALSTTWLIGTRGRTKTKKYKFVRIDNGK